MHLAQSFTSFQFVMEVTLQQRLVSKGLHLHTGSQSMRTSVSLAQQFLFLDDLFQQYGKLPKIGMIDMCSSKELRLLLKQNASTLHEMASRITKTPLLFRLIDRSILCQSIDQKWGLARRMVDLCQFLLKNNCDWS